jgi:hypothetical protein
MSVPRKSRQLENSTPPSSRSRSLSQQHQSRGSYSVEYISYDRSLPVKRKVSEIDIQNYVKITKNISKAFTAFTPPPLISEDQDSKRCKKKEDNEEEEPVFLKGIDCFEDMGKAEDILDSLIQIKECFYLIKQRNIFNVHDSARRLYGNLAHAALNEIYANDNRDNPKKLLDNLKKYREEERNPVLSFLWFLRDVRYVISTLLFFNGSHTM